MNLEELDRFIIKWNNNFPLDRWWRQKHNIGFLSPEHLQISFINQLLEYREDLLYKKSFEEKNKEENDYIPNTGNWLKRPYDKETFSKFDIDSFREEAERLRQEGNG